MRSGGIIVAFFFKDGAGNAVKDIGIRYRAMITKYFGFGRHDLTRLTFWLRS